jgi:uncharacterized membrane protein HdeD (DUF308 family)
MTGTRLAAVVLIVVGVLMFAYPVISFTTRDEVADLGPIEITQEERHRVPMPPILGGIAVVVGLGLLFMGRGRTA